MQTHFKQICDVGGANEILNSTYFAQILGYSPQGFMFLRRCLCSAWVDQFHTVGGCLASKTSPGHCLIYLGTWIRASGFTWLDHQSPLETRGIQNHCSYHCSLPCSPWPPDATSSQSPPLSPLGQQDWQKARGDREGTQTRLKEGETKSHPPDLWTKLRLTDTGVSLRTHIPHVAKPETKSRCLDSSSNLFFRFALSPPSGEMPTAGHRKMWWVKEAKVWGKENGKKDPRWQEFFLAGMPLFIRLYKLFIDALLSQV